jgi:hypothetical protein
VDALLKKLNFRSGECVVLDGPAELTETLARWSATATVSSSVSGPCEFVLCFVKSAADVARMARHAVPSLVDDGVLWMAYPKKTSKRYEASIDRDHGWDALGRLGFEPVRQVAIDADWSALRFREARHIKGMTRRQEMALSDEGKRRASGN